MHHSLARLSRTATRRRLAGSAPGQGSAKYQGNDQETSGRRHIWTGHLNEFGPRSLLDAPLTVAATAAKIFVNSMSDLFQDCGCLSMRSIASHGWSHERRRTGYTFIRFLTKRPDRNAGSCIRNRRSRCPAKRLARHVGRECRLSSSRIDVLRSVPASDIRFVSFEPLLWPRRARSISAIFIGRLSGAKVALAHDQSTHRMGR